MTNLPNFFHLRKTRSGDDPRLRTAARHALTSPVSHSAESISFTCVAAFSNATSSSESHSTSGTSAIDPLYIEPISSATLRNDPVVRSEKHLCPPDHDTTNISGVPDSSIPMFIPLRDARSCSSLIIEYEKSIDPLLYVAYWSLKCSHPILVKLPNSKRASFTTESNVFCVAPVIFGAFFHSFLAPDFLQMRSPHWAFILAHDFCSCAFCCQVQAVPVELRRQDASPSHWLW